ncbi:GNAT family N-acetyltransferase [Parabacteroides sp. APC149_11_2_Y6]
MEYSDTEFVLKYGLQVRLVVEEDAEFIVALRTDKRLSRFISVTDANVSNQVEWIRAYKEREKDGKEYYFIFFINGVRLGLSRIYNIKDNHFTQGSWLFSPNAPVGSSVLGNIISCEFAFELPNMEYLMTDARRDNHTHKYVRSFHPEILGENELDIFYRISKENYTKYKHAHIRLCEKVMKQELASIFK